MARGVRFTKAEAAIVRALVAAARPEGPKAKTYDSIVAKLDAAEQPGGIDIGPIQAALVRAAHGKVLELEGGHAVASRRALAMKVTVEQAELVGGWMSRQTWLTTPMTILDVFNKWYQWLPKARATEPPPSLQPGLGTNGTRQGTGAPGTKTSGGRPAPGFR